MGDTDLTMLAWAAMKNELYRTRRREWREEIWQPVNPRPEVILPEGERALIVEETE